MSGGIFSGINWSAWSGAAAMLAVAALLMAWQYKGDPSRSRGWIGIGALSLELLAAAMALSWAMRQGQGALALFFAVGFIGLALSKATTAGALVQNWRSGNWAGVIIGGATLVGVYLTVYFAASFDGTIHSAKETAEAAVKSAPVQAVDAQLAAARDRLSNLAGYADAAKAHAEEQAVEAQSAAQQRRVAELERQVDQARAEAAPWADNNCNPKNDSKGRPYTSRAAEACAKIDAAVMQLARERSGAGAASGGYADRHREYAGLRQHIGELEEKRARMLADGGSAQAEASGADNKLIAWLLGMDIDRAAGVKWLFFVLAFDLLSLGLRIFSELQGGGEIQDAKRKFSALLAAGMTPPQAAAIVGGGESPRPLARVSRPHLDGQPEQLRTGGRILSDGIYEGHADECVLNAEATRYVDELFPGWLDSVNGGRLEHPLGWVQRSATPPYGRSAAFSSVTSHGTSDGTSDAPSDAPSHGTSDGTSDAPSHVERVAEELSGKAAKGRQGLLDSCVQCGRDYTVKKWNQTFCCVDCSAVAAGYTDAAARREAFQKARKQ